MARHETTRRWGVATLVVTAIIVLAGLTHHTGPALVAAVLALAVVGLRLCIARPAPAAPDPGPAPAPPAAPTPVRVEAPRQAPDDHLRASLLELKDRIEQLASDMRFSECVARVEATQSLAATCVNGLGESTNRLDVVRSVMFQILGQISELTDISDRISGMVDVIRRIASQTNLLALNATIEAARAGDAGRSFAVVAGEVRKLADDSRAATESIDHIVTEVRAVTEATIEVANSASDELEHSRAQLGVLDGSFTDIAQELQAAVESVEYARQHVHEHIAALGAHPSLARVR